MATIVLGTVGASIGGSAFGIGTMAAAAVGTGFAVAGAYLDQAYVYPAILPTPDQEGQRIEQIPGPKASENSSIELLYGPSNRLGGTVLWVPSMLIEEKHVESMGKGGDVTTYKYFTHIAIGLCEGVIDSVTRIWANGELIYKKPIQDITVISTTLAVTPVSVMAGFGPSLMTITSGTIDLSVFRRGGITKTSGFSNGGNNGTFICINHGVNPSGDSFVTLINSSAVTEAAGETVTVKQLVVDLSSFRSDKVQDVRVYKGTTTQLPDALLALSGQFFAAPGYRGIAYIVLEKVALEDFGNHIPQFSFEVSKDAATTSGDTIADILERAGLTSADYNVSGLAENMRGYHFGERSPVRALRPLMRAHNIGCREMNGELSFIERGTERIIEINNDVMAAREEGDDAPRVMTITDVADHNLPNEINVAYHDYNKDHALSSQRARRVVQKSPTSMQIQLPITMTEIEARAIAERELRAAWINRQAISLSLPPSYLDVQEQDVLKITLNSFVYYVLVTSITRGFNFLLNIEGVLESPESYTSDFGADLPWSIGDASEIVEPPYLMLAVIDIAPLRSEDVNVPGIYYGAASIDPDGGWDGASIYRSVSGDVEANYALWNQALIESAAGYTTTVLAAGPIGYWDRENTVTVHVPSGELISTDEADVREGANYALLGDEIIAFQDAILIATDTYTLSNLLRGRRGTAVSGHAVGDRFMMLDSVQFGTVDSSRIGQDLWYRPMSSGQDLSDVEGLDHKFTAGTCTPFAPPKFEGARDVSDNIVFTWERASLYPYRIFGSVPMPGVLWGEEYKIEYYTAGDVLKRTVTELTAKTDTYTAAEQTTDGITPGDTIKAKVYQTGFYVAYGPEADLTVT